MIYEDFNRPHIARILERLVFAKSKKKHSFGIMQVQSDMPLTDEESIVRGTSIITEAVKHYSAEVDDRTWVSYHSLISDVSSHYNGGYSHYCTEVEEIFEHLQHNYFLEETLTKEELKRMVADLDS